MNPKSEPIRQFRKDGSLIRSALQNDRDKLIFDEGFKQGKKEAFLLWQKTLENDVREAKIELLEKVGWSCPIGMDTNCGCPAKKVEQELKKLKKKASK